MTQASGPGIAGCVRRPVDRHRCDAAARPARCADSTFHVGGQNEAHETILGAGIETHAPHRHIHEEIIIVVEGTVETYNDGRTDTVEAGSVIFFGSNQMHSARNVGTIPARYYVIELRGDEQGSGRRLTTSPQSVS